MADKTSGEARLAAGLAGVGALGLALGLLAGTVHGQEGDSAELTKLVFEPMPLARALESPRDLSAAARDEAALEAALDERLAAVERARRRRADDLVEQLGLLAVAYQQLDRHDEALAALDEGVALTVAEGGRRNAAQIPLLEQKIPSYRALDDVDGIDDTEDLVYELKERVYGAGSRQMYYATINLADWNMAAYYRENFGAGNRALQRQRGVLTRVQRCISIPGSASGEGSSGCLEGPIFTGEIRGVFDQDINDVRLRRIDRLYTDYQEALFESGNVQLDIVIDVAKRVARLAYATKQEMDFERDNYHYDPNYDGSREQEMRNSAERLDESYLTGEKALKYAIEFPSSVASFRPEALAAAHLDLGDWHLAYGKAAAAREAYREAYRVLLEAGFTSDNVDLALATDMPIRIPVFATHLYTRRSTGVGREAALRFRGFVDLSYTVDELGNADDLRFLESSTPHPAELERLITLQLKSMKFRPALRGGNLVAPGLVEARYYYAY